MLLFIYQAEIEDECFILYIIVEKKQLPGAMGNATIFESNFTCAEIFIANLMPPSIVIAKI